MKLIEKQGDIFSELNDSKFICCSISRDFVTRTEFFNQLDLKYKLRENLSKIYLYGQSVISVDRVFLLITRDKFWLKPNYSLLEHSLQELEMKFSDRIKEIRFSKRDFVGFNYIRIREILNRIFENTLIQPVIYV